MTQPIEHSSGFQRFLNGNRRQILQAGALSMLGLGLDHFDPKGGREELHTAKESYRPACKGGNYFDVQGNARCAVRLGLAGSESCILVLVARETFLDENEY